MTRARRPTAVAYFATAVLVLVIVLLWAVPGYLVTRCPVSATVDGRLYCAEPISLTVTPCPTGGVYCAKILPPPTFLLWGVAFELQYGTSPGAGGDSGVGGHVTEPDGHSFTFGLQGDPLGPAVMNWTSPDASVLVEWPAPYATNESGGRIGTTVDCGVLFALVAGE